jgi:hypothetical protein
VVILFFKIPAGATIAIVSPFLRYEGVINVFVFSCAFSDAEIVNKNVVNTISLFKISLFSNVWGFKNLLNVNVSIFNDF